MGDTRPCRCLSFTSCICDTAARQSTETNPNPTKLGKQVAAQSSFRFWRSELGICRVELLFELEPIEPCARRGRGSPRAAVDCFVWFRCPQLSRRYGSCASPLGILKYIVRQECCYDIIGLALRGTRLRGQSRYDT